MGLGLEALELDMGGVDDGGGLLGGAVGFPAEAAPSGEWLFRLAAMDKALLLRGLAGALRKQQFPMVVVPGGGGGGRWASRDEEERYPEREKHVRRERGKGGKRQDTAWNVEEG